MAALVFVSFLTSLISGIFGMAGGIIMMGYLVWVFPVATAAILHGIIQACSNSSRVLAFRRHVLWLPIFNVGLGLFVTFLVFNFLSVQLSKPWVYLGLGLLSPLAFLGQSKLRLDILNPWHQILCGISMGGLCFTAGVSGPVIDIFFANTKANRFEQVGTKAVIALLSHAFKIIYFWTLFSAEVNIPTAFWWILPLIVGVSLAGTYLGKKILAGFGEKKFSVYVWRVLFLVSFFYLSKAYSSWFL